jgi:16S rRNA (adenine(1408)-N(1))-methyltransferase
VETICGTRSLSVDNAALSERLRAYHDVAVDLGTGDGRYVRQLARRTPNCLAIGIDLCRENLREVSRRAPDNALYLIADALALPVELAGVATQISINFAWGSLIQGLLRAELGLYDGLRRLARPSGAWLDITLNERALVVAGCSLDTGERQLRANLREAGFQLGSIAMLDRVALRDCRTSWAKRIAHGDDVRALHLRARVC